MVLRWVDGFERDIGQRLEVEEAGAAGSWARAYAGASFEPGEMQQTPPRELVALLAAIATDPALLEPLRRRFEAWQARAEDDGLDLVRCHRSFDECMTPAVYRGENAGGTDEESLRG